MKPLKAFAIGAEATVILTLAASSYHIAFSGAPGMSDWLAGAPILTVVALEMLRLPIAFNMVKSRLVGFVMSVAMIAGLSVITGEAASLAFENLIFQRTRPVVEAEAELAKVNISHGTLDEVNARRAQEITRLTADLDAARKHRQEIGEKGVDFAPPVSDHPCNKGTKKKPVWVNCNSGIQALQAKSNADVQAAHSAELKSASEQVAKAEERLAAASANPPDMHVSDEAVATAKQKVADARSMNPMFRVAAAWQRIPVQDLTSEQFEQVKHYAVIALAAATRSPPRWRRSSRLCLSVVRATVSSPRHAVDVLGPSQDAASHQGAGGHRVQGPDEARLRPGRCRHRQGLGPGFPRRSHFNPEPESRNAMNDEIHDTSRVDAFMASRRRAMFLHAIWRPMLAGAAGAAIIVATVWAASPRFHYNDIEIPRVTVRDVTVDHVVPRDVPVDHVVPHDVPVDHIVPHDVPMPGPAPTSKPPVASAPPMGPDSPYAAKTPEENKFVDKPEYKDAAYHGRIVKSVDGRALSFADGKNFRPGRWDDATGKPVDDPSMANDSDPYIGDLGMCVPDPKHHELWNCTAFHSGQETPIGGKPAQTSTWSNPTPSHIDEARCQDKWAPMFDPQCKAKSADGTPPAMSMVNVDVDISGYSVKAMVDTGCSWPMAIPKVLANILLKDGRAARTSPAKSTLADGSVKDTDVIVINQITVDGRVLQDVVAAIGESDSAPILLGLGALNRLCHYSITDGRIVFTGNQPA